jgi:hypothetical protein
MSGRLEQQALEAAVRVLCQTQTLANHICTGTLYPQNAQSIRYRDKLQKHVATLGHIGKLLGSPRATSMNHDFPTYFQVLKNFQDSLQEHISKRCADGPDKVKLQKEAFYQTADELEPAASRNQVSRRWEVKLKYRLWKAFGGVIGEDETLFNEMQFRGEELQRMESSLKKSLA